MRFSLTSASAASALRNWLGEGNCEGPLMCGLKSCKSTLRYACPGSASSSESRGVGDAVGVLPPRAPHRTAVATEHEPSDICGEHTFRPFSTLAQTPEVRVAPLR